MLNKKINKIKKHLHIKHKGGCIMAWSCVISGCKCDRIFLHVKLPKNRIWKVWYDSKKTQNIKNNSALWKSVFALLCCAYIVKNLNNEKGWMIFKRWV